MIALFSVGDGVQFPLSWWAEVEIGLISVLFAVHIATAKRQVKTNPERGDQRLDFLRCPRPCPKRARSTLRILLRHGRTACVIWSRAPFAELSVESPLTKNNSQSLASLLTQSVSFAPASRTCPCCCFAECFPPPYGQLRGPAGRLTALSMGALRSPGSLRRTC